MGLINNDSNTTVTLIKCLCGCRYYANCQRSPQWGCPWTLWIATPYFLCPLLCFSFLFCYHCPTLFLVRLLDWNVTSMGAGVDCFVHCCLPQSLKHCLAHTQDSKRTYLYLYRICMNHTCNEWMDSIHLTFTTCLWSSHYLPYSTDEQMGTEGLSNLPKVTQPLEGRISTWAQEVWLQKLALQACVQNGKSTCRFDLQLFSG